MAVRHPFATSQRACARSTTFEFAATGQRKQQGSEKARGDMSPQMGMSEFYDQATRLLTGLALSMSIVLLFLMTSAMGQ